MRKVEDKPHGALTAELKEPYAGLAPGIYKVSGWWLPTKGYKLVCCDEYIPADKVNLLVDGKAKI